MAAEEQSPLVAVDNPQRHCWHDFSRTVEGRMVTCRAESQPDAVSTTDH